MVQGVDRRARPPPETKALEVQKFGKREQLHGIGCGSLAPSLHFPNHAATRQTPPALLLPFPPLPPLPLLFPPFFHANLVCLQHAPLTPALFNTRFRPPAPPDTHLIDPLTLMDSPHVLAIASARELLTPSTDCQAMSAPLRLVHFLARFSADLRPTLRRDAWARKYQPSLR